MKQYLFITLFLLAAVSYAATPIVYNGDTLEWDNDFKRTQTGSSPREMPEISGMSCSRVTPGYFWIQSDENFFVAAMNAKGKIMCKHGLSRVMADNVAKKRKDWEGLSTGVYLGRNTIFVGGFGDNDCWQADAYYIYYFEEPEIPSVRNTATTDYKITIDTNYIWYGYPDGKGHNTEAIMYDNVDQMLYIVDKTEKNVNTVYSLDMKDTVYDCTKMVRLKEVCKLGKEGEIDFQRATAADITPDGRWILIKNNYYVPRGNTEDTYAYTLIWERNAGESVGDALRRQPKQVAAYKTEWQGETLAWLDSTTFYTTSDDDGSAPIYKYVRWPWLIPPVQPDTIQPQPQPQPQIEEADTVPNEPQTLKMVVNGQVFIRSDKEEMFTPSGQKIN